MGQGGGRPGGPLEAGRQRNALQSSVALACQECARPQTKLGEASETQQLPPGAPAPHLGAVPLPKSTCCQASISHPSTDIHKSH